MAWKRRDGWPRDTTVVAFAATPEQAGMIVLAEGPCVPLPGRRKPLVSPLLQDGREIPRQTATLFTVLTGQPSAGALIQVERDGRSQLSRVSEAFLDAMADECEHQLRLGEEDDAVGDKSLTRFASRRDELDRAWLGACKWDSSLVGTGNKLGRLGTARSARLDDSPMYFWHGPPVPMRTVISGSGPYPGKRP